MGLFEFIMVLISVIVGLALTEILTGAANLLRERRTVRFYWLHNLFQLGVFFALLQQWWESWELVDLTVISFGDVLLRLFPSIVLFLIAHLLYPSSVKNANLEEHYFDQSALLWGLALLGTIQGNIVSPLLRGVEVFDDPANWLGFPVILCLLALTFSGNRRVHSILGPVVLSLIILDTWLVTPQLVSG